MVDLFRMEHSHRDSIQAQSHLQFEAALLILGRLTKGLIPISIRQSEHCQLQVQYQDCLIDSNLQVLFVVVSWSDRKLGGDDGAVGNAEN